MRCEDAAGTAVITLARPPVNALDAGAIGALEAIFQRLADHPPAAGAVLTGEGAVFSAGVDVRAFARYDPQQRRQLALAITRMTAAALALPCPLVAAINGHALGGGFVLTLCCDFRVAVDAADLRLGIPEARAGVPFPAGPLQIIRHELPPGWLRRLALSSEAETPRRLLEAGVLDGLAPPETLMSVARARRGHGGAAGIRHGEAADQGRPRRGPRQARRIGRGPIPGQLRLAGPGKGARRRSAVPVGDESVLVQANADILHCFIQGHGSPGGVFAPNEPMHRCGQGVAFWGATGIDVGWSQPGWALIPRVRVCLPTRRDQHNRMGLGVK